MIKLDYRTNNPRWGLSGVYFEDWNEYSFMLGFLSNIRHFTVYDKENVTNFDKTISIHIERNSIDGAWQKECRIHYYGNEDMLNNLITINKCGSAGLGKKIIKRVNSNNYINSLINDYNFRIIESESYIQDVLPPIENNIWSILENNLISSGFQNEYIKNLKIDFNKGWNL